MLAFSSGGGGRFVVWLFFVKSLMHWFAFRLAIHTNNFTHYFGDNNDLPLFATGGSPGTIYIANLTNPYHRFKFESAEAFEHH